MPAREIADRDGGFGAGWIDDADGPEKVGWRALRRPEDSSSPSNRGR